MRHAALVILTHVGFVSLGNPPPFPSIIVLPCRFSCVLALFSSLRPQIDAVGGMTQRTDHAQKSKNKRENLEPRSNNETNKTKKVST